MEEINLLQNRINQSTYAWEHQSRWVNGLLTLLLVLALGGWGALYILNRGEAQQLQTAQAQNQTLENQVNQQETGLDNAKALQAQAANIQALLSTHVYMTPLFDELNKLTYVQAQYNTFSMDPTGLVHLEGTTSSYDALGKLLLGLSTSSNFTDVELLSVAPAVTQKSNFAFSINLRIKPTLLKQN